MSQTSRPPWLDDPSQWGRLRLNEKRWRAAYRATSAYLAARWQFHHTLPNPSPESRESLTEIRELEKVIDTLEHLGEEKGWPLPSSVGGSISATRDQPTSGQ